MAERTARWLSPSSPTAGCWTERRISYRRTTRRTSVPRAVGRPRRRCHPRLTQVPGRLRQPRSPDRENMMNSRRLCMSGLGPTRRLAVNLAADRALEVHSELRRIGGGSGPFRRSIAMAMTAVAAAIVCAPAGLPRSCDGSPAAAAEPSKQPLVVEQKGPEDQGSAPATLPPNTDPANLEGVWKSDHVRPLVQA